MDSVNPNTSSYICTYLPYFETLDPKTAYKVTPPRVHDDGSMSLSGFNYDDKFLQFTDDFYESGLLVKDYHDVLNQRLPDWQSVDIIKVLETTDLELTKAILTKCVRVERFCDGAWVSAIEDGLFLAILRRLNTLLLTETM